MPKKGDKSSNSGRKQYQTTKAFLIYQYLMQNSDENNIVKTADICDQFKDYKISAEERSVRRDIEAMNKAILLAEGVADDINQATELCEDKENCTIVYDTHRKGFYIQKRQYQTSDIRAITESIYAARFLDSETSSRLVDTVCDKFVSIMETERIRHSVDLTDRVETDRVTLYTNIELINHAMSTLLNGEKHIPEAIKFKYMKYTIQDAISRSQRQHSETITLFPCKLLINDGNYYLLGSDLQNPGLQIFHVDRMKDVKLTGIKQHQHEMAKQIDIDNFAEEYFGKFGSNKEHVTLQFDKSLLDTMIDTFGITDAVYGKIDNHLYKVTVHVAVSNRFFGWILSLGENVKIIAPNSAKERFTAHLDKMREIHM